MLSGTAEPECRERPPAIVPALRDAVSGADAGHPDASGDSDIGSRRAAP